MQIEFLLAYDDGRWTTDTFEVPISPYDREKAVDWMEENAMRTAALRDVVCVQVYNVPEPDDEPEIDPDEDIPDDFPVKVLGPNDPAQCRATCGTCGRCWDDAIVTSMTPAPSGRCPFEAFHDEE